MDIYYPGNIVIRLIQPRLARNQAEEGGVPRARDSLLSGHQSICQQGGKPIRVKKTRQIGNLEPGFDSIETERAPGASPGML
jgi:hypothetical protein